MKPAGPRAEWVPRPLAFVALAAVAVAVTLHAEVGFRGAYLTYVSGVWLSLARDLSDGVLYRDLVSELGFGGTRYFPVFFSIVALLHKGGVSLVAAGWLVGSVAMVLLCSGAYRLAAGAGAPTLTAAMLGAAVTGPYFAMQTTFEIRADVLAAAFNLWGVALVAPAFRGDETGDRFRSWPAVICFLLATGTKITAAGIPIGVVLALVLTRRLRLARRFSALLAAQVAGFLVLVQWLSDGRALRVWGASLFGGSDAAGTISELVSAGFLGALVSSNLVITVAAIAVVTLVAAFVSPSLGNPDRTDVPALFPASLWVAASATLALNLSSPGTVPSNQLPEWMAVSVLLPVFLTGRQSAVRRVLAMGIAVLSIWMAVQNFARAAERRPVVTAERVNQRREFVARLKAFPAPILSESALWPLLADQEVLVPDPFAARTVFRARPELERQLIEGILGRKYSAIVLEFDPASKTGRGMYEFAHFSLPIVSAIESQYRRLEQGLPDVFVFVPRSIAAAVDTPSRY